MYKENIQHELQQGSSIEYICTKYNLTFKELVDLFICGMIYHKISENIYKNGQKYRIQQTINGKSIVFGSYFNLKEALEVRDEIKRKNWNVDLTEYLGDTYILKRSWGYVIQKEYNQKLTYYGAYRTVNDARRVRDMLVKYNWNKKCLNEICKKIGVEKLGH